MSLELETEERMVRLTTPKRASATRGTRRGVALVATIAFAVLQIALGAGPASARYNDQPDGGNDGGSGVGSDGPPPYVHPDDGFSWVAPNRYKQWVDAWHQRGWTRDWPTETYRPDYVNPSKWAINVMGCETKADYEYDLYPDAEGAVKPTTQYRWKWNGHTVAFGTDCYTALQFPAQGSYYVELTVRHADGTEQTYTKPVRVKDYLIVVLGDSSASGEGAVDDRIYPWTPDGTRAEWVDNRCHRSQNAGGPQAAKAIEQSDPTTSVTFLSFACSGASLDTNFAKSSNPAFPYVPLSAESSGTGITGPYVGIEDPDDGSYLPAQTEALYNALTDNGAHAPRKIDVLIVAAGINDVRFSKLAAMCVLYDNCYAKPINPLDPFWSLDNQYSEDAYAVPDKWAKFRQQLADYGIEADKRLALEYPPFFHNENGGQCLAVFDDILPPLAWLPDEIGWADTYWAPMLNQYAELGATQSPSETAFEWVGGIASDFYLHGMCSADPYINTANASSATQGDDEGIHGNLENKYTTGTAHPNTKGYGVYRERILDHVQSLLENQPPVAVSDKLDAAVIYGGWVNVLDNDYDADGDTLTARVFSQPQHGTVTVGEDGMAFYKPDHGYAGTDQFYYEISDGEFTRFTSVAVTVHPPVIASTEVLPGGDTTIGGMIGDIVLSPPYEVILDKPLPATRGEIIVDPHLDTVYFTAPATKYRRTVKMPYTVFSRTTDRTDPSFGSSVRGVLKIRIVRKLHS